MVDITKLLGEAKELGASDVHITVGVPPKMRIQGQLKSMDFDRMLPDETEKLLTSIMTEEQKAYLDKNGEWADIDNTLSLISNEYTANNKFEIKLDDSCLYIDKPENTNNLICGVDFCLFC